MLKTLRTKLFTNIVGTNIEIDETFAFADGCYRQYEAACNAGSVKIWYTKTERIYKNFTHLNKQTVTQTADYFAPNSTATIRQMAVRAYNDTHGLILGDNDYYERTLTNIYIKRIRNAATFALSEANGTAVFATECQHPVLSCAGQTQYYPPFTAPMVAETIWNGRHCEFYMTAFELERASYFNLLFLADANTDVTIHGGTSMYSGSYFDSDEWSPSEHLIDKLHITDNSLVRYVSLDPAAESCDLVLQNTPNISYIRIFSILPQESAQSVADTIAASTIEGTYTGNAGTYQSIISAAIANNPKWTKVDLQ